MGGSLHQHQLLDQYNYPHQEESHLVSSLAHRDRTVIRKSSELCGTLSRVTRASCISSHTSVCVGTGERLCGVKALGRSVGESMVSHIIERSKAKSKLALDTLSTWAL